MLCFSLLELVGRGFCATSCATGISLDRCTSRCFRVRDDGVGYAAGPGYLITYLVRRHARVELRPNFLGPERISSSAELALRFYFLVALQNLVDLGAR